MADPYANFTEKPEPPFESILDIGFSEDMNAPFRRTMEDGKCMIDAFGGDSAQGFFAIYDGHGGTGAVHYVEQNLHNNLLIELEDAEDSEVQECITRAYLRTDENMKQVNVGYSGTTSITVLLRAEVKEVDGKPTKVRKLYASNCGDARVVLNRGGKALRMTRDHKGSDPEEVKRIEKAGGFVAYNRVNGILAVTRALGDFEMKDFVIADPDHSVVELNTDDTFVILACDGLWDVVEDQEAVDLVSSVNTMQEASDLLLQTALKKRSTDNVSIMVVKLRTDTPEDDEDDD